MINNRLVILSPGWGNSTWHLKPMERRFKEEGYDVFIVVNTQDGIRQSAMRLAGVLQKAHETYDHITFIGYSMGGLVGRYLIYKFPEFNYINSYVSIASPHRGSRAAELAIWSKTAHEMKINSELFRELEDTDWPIQIPALAIQAEYDGLVIPNANSELKHAENIEIPKTTHISIVMSARTFHEIHSWISSIFFPEDFQTVPEKKGISLTIREVL